MRLAARLFIILLAAPLSIIACNDDDPGIPFTDAQTTAARDAVDAVMADLNVPGVMAMVWEGGRDPLVIVKGHADIQSGSAIRDSDLYRIASVTKTFTATAVLLLADDGLLDLDRTIHAYFPEVPRSDQITIRQLLNMTAGVFDFFYEDPDVQWYYLNEPLRVWTKQALYNRLITHAPAFEPGTDCHYSNANYFLLGLLVETVSEGRLEDFIRQRILEPLGLGNTIFPTGPDMPESYAHGYRDSAAPGILEDISRVHPSLSWAGGAMISNLYDLKVWARELYKSSLLSPGMQNQRLQTENMIHLQTENKVLFINYGLGIMDWGGFWGHDGAILGYNNFVTYLPEKDSVILVVTTKCNEDGIENPAQDVFLRITRILYPEYVSW